MKCTSRLSRSSFDYDHRTLGFARGFDGNGKLRPAIEGVGALPRLDLGKGFDDPPALYLRKAPDGFTLGLNSQPGCALLLGTDPEVSDHLGGSRPGGRSPYA